MAAYYEARAATVPAATRSAPAATRRRRRRGRPRRRRTVGDTVRAYVALTKPRIIELLLVTTVPAMVLATRDVPGISSADWLRLAFWTLLGGTLAAGSANAINRYLDRDIDELMSPDPATAAAGPQVEPERAVVFGIVLGVISIALMAWFVNLVAAFLTLLAIAFYVVVYTILLKRSTPQNIVIGGAAGALPPVIGWAAVTGEVEHPGAAAVRAGLLLDAAPLLGARAADPQGLRGGRRADAPGRPRRARDRAPDRALLAAPGRDLARVLRGRADGRDLPRRGGRARRDLPVARVHAVAAVGLARGLARPGDPPVQLLDHVPDAAVRGGRGRRLVLGRLT